MSHRVMLSWLAFGMNFAMKWGCFRAPTRRLIPVPLSQWEICLSRLVHRLWRFSDAICDEHGWSMFATLKILIPWYAARSTTSIPQRSCGEVRACDPSATMFIWKLGRSNTCHRWKSNYPMPKVSGLVKQILSGLPWMKIDGVQISSISLY